MKKVTLNDLDFGDKFWYRGEVYLYVEGPAPRQHCHAVNLKTYQITYFGTNEPAMFTFEEPAMAAFEEDEDDKKDLYSHYFPEEWADKRSGNLDY